MSSYYSGQEQVRTVEVRLSDGSFDGYHLIPEPGLLSQSVHVMPPLVDQINTHVASEAAPAEWWHVAWCLTCTDGKSGEIPFLSEEARTEWVDSHQESTGHKEWRLVSVRKRLPGWRGEKA